MPEDRDTIVAVATPPGRGGIGVVRVSGPAARPIAAAICGRAPAVRCAEFHTFRDADGEVLDRGIALFFPAPHSFTGEDVLELHAHGSPLVLDALCRRACALGARPARAGEFSERAFLEGRLDLTQAEAIADLIAARSDVQVRAAQRSIAGEFSRRVDALLAAVVRFRVEVEAAIDFAEDASESAAPARLAALSDAASAGLAELLAAARRGVRLADGLHAVIVGPPNVGKSSLLNALAGAERAIVTDIPGTTRDVLREAIELDGVEVSLADTAGLRESRDAIESEGIRRARAELAHADLILVVSDDAVTAAVGAAPTGLPDRARWVRIVNKIDLTGRTPWRSEGVNAVTIGLSARTGAGVGLLREELRRVALGGAAGGDFSARARHVAALERTRVHLDAARAAIGTCMPELVAEDLRQAQRALGEITGAFSTDDLLGAIFSTFCVGK